MITQSNLALADVVMQNHLSRLHETTIVQVCAAHGTNLLDITGTPSVAKQNYI